MHPDWSWQAARSRMLSPLPAHLQPPTMHQRFMHHQRQQALIQQQQQAQARAFSHLHSRSSSDSHRSQWQEQSRSSRSNIPIPEDKTKAVKVSPKPEAVSHSKSTPLKEQSENLKRKLPDWSGCVEGTSPQLMKRRVLYSGDCGRSTYCLVCVYADKYATLGIIFLM